MYNCDTCEKELSLSDNEGHVLCNDCYERIHDDDVPNIPLAGHGLNKDTLLSVAWWLLLDIYWDDEMEAEYRKTCTDRGDKWEHNLVDRPVSPAVPDELDALMKLSYICGRIEQAWGESFYSVSRRMVNPDQQAHLNKEELMQTLIYRTIMACIGHGTGPNDDGNFPGELLTSPISFENPMQYQLDILP